MRKPSFKLWHDDHPYVLHNSIFFSQKTLSIYRFIIILFFLSQIIWMLSTLSWTYFVYMTNWGFCTGFLFFLMTTIENYYVKNSNSFIWKLSHIIFEIAITVEFSIFIFYWTALFYLDYDEHKNDSDFAAWLFNDICIHLLGFVFLWIDNIFNHIEIFLSHFFLIVIFETCYMIVNCVYTLNVKNIYPPITWTDAVSYVCIVVVLILLIGHHYFAIWFFHRYKKIRIEKEKESDRNNTLL